MSRNLGVRGCARGIFREMGKLIVQKFGALTALPLTVQCRSAGALPGDTLDRKKNAAPLPISIQLGLRVRA